MDTEERGIFACRAPKRPNAIGLSTVRLIGIEGNVLQVEQVDMLDGTPLLDIKPFFGRFDNRDGTRNGWMDKRGELSVESLRSDDRFGKES
jgi:tRNA (Thr-GGU) A37 N-methylase